MIETTGHDPLCEQSPHYCVCDLIREAEQRGRKAEWVNQQDEMQAAHDRGYEQGQRDALASNGQRESDAYKKGWEDATRFAAEQAGMRLSRNPQRTSVSAVRETMPRAGTKLLAIYELICKSGSGLTDFEIEEATGMAHQSASAARNVLMNRGLIKDAGVTRKNARGMDAIVWIEARPASKEINDLSAAYDRHPAGRHLRAVPDPGDDDLADSLLDFLDEEL